MTALEQKLLEQLEQEQQLNNQFLMILKNLFQQQNNLIIQNTEKMKELNQTIENQQKQIEKLAKSNQQLAILLQNLINILNQELM